jgi:hypothetical protein
MVKFARVTLGLLPAASRVEGINPSIKVFSPATKALGVIRYRLVFYGREVLFRYMGKWANTFTALHGKIREDDPRSKDRQRTESRASTFQ